MPDKEQCDGGKKGRNNSENVKVREGGEEGVLQAPEKRFPHRQYGRTQ